MAIVIDYTKGFFEPSPAGETVGDITSSTLDLTTGNVFSDAPATSPTYRQALRDLTTQDGFPYNVVWPTKP